MQFKKKYATLYTSYEVEAIVPLVQKKFKFSTDTVIFYIYSHSWALKYLFQNIPQSTKTKSNRTTTVLTSDFGLLKYLMLKEEVVSYIYTR